MKSFRMVLPDETIQKHDFWVLKGEPDPTNTDINTNFVSSFRIGNKLENYIMTDSSYNLWREVGMGDEVFRLPGNKIYAQELPLP